MKIYGLEKLSLVDYDGHTAATVFTGGCNFRCPYCHNGALVELDKTTVQLPENEVLEYLNKRKGLLDGLAVTGGEPTLEKGLEEFLVKVKELGYDIKLDSNGTHPEVLAHLIDKKLVDYIAMDIKNSPEKYPLTVGKKNLDLEPIKKSVELLLQNKVGYEFRTTVVRQFHDVSDFEKIGEFIKGAEKYFIQKFRDRGGCLEDGFSEIPEEEAEVFIEKIKPFVKNASLRGY